MGGLKNFENFGGGLFLKALIWPPKIFSYFVMRFFQRFWEHFYFFGFRQFFWWGYGGGRWEF